MSRAVLGLEGPETENFLHNLVTADILGLAEGEARYAALLTPQGKILFDFFVVKTAEGYLLDCAASQLEELAEAAGVLPAAGEGCDYRAQGFGSWRFAGAAPGMTAYADPRTPAYRVAGDCRQGQAAEGHRL